MKLLKNKTVLGVAAILCGILICFILSPIYNKSLEAKVKIVRIIKEVEKGHQITSDAVKEISVGSYNLPEDVVRDKDSVIGKYARTDLYIGDYILESKISAAPLSNNEYLEKLDGKEGAVSITLQTFASGLSGKLLNGDIVSIIATNTNNNSTEIPPELTYVKVLTCTNAQGTDVDENTVNEDSENGNLLPATVTLLVDDRQAELLANLENTQKLHIKLVYRGEDTECQKFLKEQDKVLEQLEAAQAESEQNQEGTGSDTTEEGE